MARVYYAAGGTEEIALPRSLSGCLRRLQTIVGGPIEVLAVRDQLLVFHKEGKLRRLPLNLHATAIARPYMDAWDWGIVGNAVLATWEELELLDPAPPDDVRG